MPIVTKPLNATEVKNAKPKDKEYRLSDGQGLQLRVSPSGDKQWQRHTMTRPFEASGAKWNDIDINEKVWTIPAERMKKRREHRTPLTEQALELLEGMENLLVKS